MPAKATQLQKVRLLTNQYKISLAEELGIYQYEIVVTPDVTETYLFNSIVYQARKMLSILVGLYVQSGRTIFTVASILENFHADVKFGAKSYVVSINKEFTSFFTSKNFEDSSAEDHLVIHNLLNNILKRALQDSTYKQIGKLPRFFNLKKQMEVDGGLIAFPGFKASTYKCSNSTTIVIDNLFKFITSNTCLEKIKEIRYQNPDGDYWKELVEAEFVNRSVLVQWGNRRAYIIKRILFDEHPETKKFQTDEGVEWTITEYFQKTYKLTIKSLKQPLFEVMMGGKACHLPPEYCVFDGVPDIIRKDPFKMRNIMKHCSKNPEQKFSEIEMFTHELF